MKKFLIGIVVVAVFVAYILYERSAQNVIITNGNSTTTSIESSSTSKFKDGTYTGPVADAFYGPMQVQVIIQGGKISDIKFLQYPNHLGHTSEVSASALPILKQEAIQSQSANVDTISGATQTTDGFKQSLEGALSLAR
jgi:uncharacterized protein with FMN-binding domain